MHIVKKETPAKDDKEKERENIVIREYYYASSLPIQQIITKPITWISRHHLPHISFSLTFAFSLFTPHPTLSPPPLISFLGASFFSFDYHCLLFIIN